MAEESPLSQDAEGEIIEVEDEIQVVNKTETALERYQTLLASVNGPDFDPAGGECADLLRVLSAELREQAALLTQYLTSHKCLREAEAQQLTQLESMAGTKDYVSAEERDHDQAAYQTWLARFMKRWEGISDDKMGGSLQETVLSNSPAVSLSVHPLLMPPAPSPSPLCTKACAVEWPEGVRVRRFHTCVGLDTGRALVIAQLGDETHIDERRPAVFVVERVGGGDSYSWGGGEREETMVRFTATRLESPLPAGLHRFSVTRIHGHVYVFGGKANEVVTNAMHILSVDTLEWQSRTDLPDAVLRREHGRVLSQARYGHIGECLDGRLVVIGGYSHTGHIRGCVLYDPDTDTWERAPPPAIPTPIINTGSFWAATPMGDTIHMMSHPNTYVEYHLTFSLSASLGQQSPVRSIFGQSGPTLTHGRYIIRCTMHLGKANANVAVYDTVSSECIVCTVPEIGTACAMAPVSAPSHLCFLYPRKGVPQTLLVTPSACLDMGPDGGGGWLSLAAVADGYRSEIHTQDINDSISWHKGQGE
ncbi:hypothetical protein KIPB_002563 [Kipferlia bialata]|uniref:Uncharacterized protein n=1 Tax=Kipferlia bialata TaxID=797122 RepID=A0A9K3GGC8_9EUKA|nr:hypothetical protein KIPB_002563 [Kipferlia bialata]|eukprot:g2563.t1